MFGVDNDGRVCERAAVQPTHGENKAAYYSFSSAEVQLTAVTDTSIQFYLESTKSQQQSSHGASYRNFIAPEQYRENPNTSKQLATVGRKNSLLTGRNCTAG